MSDVSCQIRDGRSAWCLCGDGLPRGLPGDVPGDLPNHSTGDFQGDLPGVAAGVSACVRPRVPTSLPARNRPRRMPRSSSRLNPRSPTHRSPSPVPRPSDHCSAGNSARDWASHLGGGSGGPVRRPGKHHLTPSLHNYLACSAGFGLPARTADCRYTEQYN